VLTLLFGLMVGPDALAFYNPTTGRWLNRDPIGEKGGKNLYVHVLNRSTVSWDRLGHATATTGDDDERKPVEGSGIRWVFSYGEGTGDVAVEYDGETICRSRSVTVTVTFNSPGPTKPEEREPCKFYCDHARTGPAEGTDWTKTVVVIKCKRGVKYCGDKENTRTVTAAYSGSPAGSATAKVEWKCNACCELEKPIHISWTYTGTMELYPSQ